MFELKTEGIVIGKFINKEYDETAIIFTEKLGKIYVKTKSTKKIISKLKISLEIFSLNNYYLIKKNYNSKYFKLIQASPIKIFNSIREDLVNLFESYIVIQLLDKFLELEDPSIEIYNLTKIFLNSLEQKIIYPLDAEIFFKIKLLQYTGFNLSDNKDFLNNIKTPNFLKKIIYKIENLNLPQNLDIIDSTKIKINHILNHYINHILNESLSSIKLMEKI